MNKRAIKVLALLLLLALGGAGADWLGLFDQAGSDSPNLATNTSEIKDRETLEPATRQNDGKGGQEPALNGGKMAQEPIEIERKLTFELAIDSGAIDPAGLEFSFAPANQSGAIVKAELSPLRKEEDFLLRTVALSYQGPRAETLILSVTITAPERKVANGELSLNLSGENAPILLQVAYGVTLRGAVYVQGGTTPFEGAKVRTAPNSQPDKETTENPTVGGVEAKLAMAHEEGISESKTVGCKPDGSFEVVGVAPGKLQVSACYPDGQTSVQAEAEVYSDMIERMDDPISNLKFGRRKPGDYAKKIESEVVGGESRDEIWLGLSLLSTLHFRVTNPIKGDCNVKLYAQETSDDGLWAAYGMGTRAGKDIALAEDGRGEFGGLTPKVVRVVLQPLGYQPREFLVEVVAGQDLDLGDITFDEAVELRGRVLDESGKGVAGVRVVVGLGSSAAIDILSGGPDDFLGRSDAPKFSAISAEDGSYSILELYGDEILVGIQHETLRFLPARVELEPSKRVIAFDITVAVAGSIKGKFLIPEDVREVLVSRLRGSSSGKEGEEEKPVGLFDDRDRNGISLLAMKAIYSPELSKMWLYESDFSDREIRSGHPDSEGVFMFDDLAPGAYELIGKLANVRTRFAQVTVKAGEASEVTLEFYKPWRLHGRITGRDGAPLANKFAYLESLVSTPYGAETFQIDANGNYDVRGLTPATYRFEVEGENIWWDHALVRRRSIILGEGEDREFNLDLAVSTGTRFFGKLTVNGQRLFNLAILATGAELGVRPSVRPIFFGEKESIEIRNVAVGRYYLRLSGNVDEASGQNTSLGVRLLLTANHVGEEVDISRDFKAWPLRGSVTLPVGVDPLGGVVWLVDTAEDEFGEDAAGRANRVLEIPLSANGTFELSTLIEGNYRAVLYHPDVARQSVSFKHDGDSSIVISALERGHSLEISAKKIHGVDIGNRDEVEVRLYDAVGGEVVASGRPILGLSVGDKLYFSGLAKGRYRIEIAAGTVVGITQLVEVGDEDTRVGLELTLAARIEIAIANPELSVLDVSDAKVSWKNLATGKVASGVPYMEALTNPDPPSKTLSAKGLSAGRWEVTIELEGYQTFKGIYETKSSQVTKAEASLVAK